MRAVVARTIKSTGCDCETRRQRDCRRFGRDAENRQSTGRRGRRYDCSRRCFQRFPRRRDLQRRFSRRRDYRRNCRWCVIRNEDRKPKLDPDFERRPTVHGTVVNAGDETLDEGRRLRSRTLKKAIGDLGVTYLTICWRLDASGCLAVDETHRPRDGDSCAESITRRREESIPSQSGLSSLSPSSVTSTALGPHMLFRRE